MVLASLGGLGGVVGTSWRLCWAMLGARWVKKGVKIGFVAQLSILMGILAPRWQDKTLQDESEGVVHGGTWVVHGGTGNNLGRPAEEAWSPRVLQSQTWSQILLSYHG